MARGYDHLVAIADTSPLAPVDVAARRRLAAALDCDGVVAASLIGSQARGDVHALSDVDIAVWVATDLDPPRRQRLRLDLLAAAEGALGTDRIDVVMLNHAPPLLRHRAIADGLLLVDRDRDERIRLETRAVLDYLDTVPLRRQLGNALRRRVREGTFGRRPAR